MFSSFKDSTFEFKDLYLIMTHIHAINHANMKCKIRDILNYPCGLKVIVKTVSKVVKVIFHHRFQSNLSIFKL